MAASKRKALKGGQRALLSTPAGTVVQARRPRAGRLAVSPLVPGKPPIILDHADIFISYSSQDEQVAEKLTKKLRKLGYKVWRAPDTSAVGPFKREIDLRLDAATAVVVIWSPASVLSDWVDAEADHGRRQEKLISVHTPGIKSPSADLPKPFGQANSLPIRNVKPITKALDQLGVPRASTKGRKR